MIASAKSKGYAKDNSGHWSIQSSNPVALTTRGASPIQPATPSSDFNLDSFMQSETDAYQAAQAYIQPIGGTSPIGTGTRATTTPTPTRTGNSGSSFGPSGDISSILSTITGTVASIFAIKAQGKAAKGPKVPRGRMLNPQVRGSKSAFPVSTIAMVGIGLVAVVAVGFIATRD